MDSAVPRIVIAGGGVAGIEALLGLRHELGRSAEIDLVAPDRDFVLRPLLVGEPFGLGRATRLDLAGVTAEHDAGYHQAAVAAVDAETQTLRTSDGEHISYDVLLLAIGARATESVPGALHFGMDDSTAELRRLLAELETDPVERVLFVAPPGEQWTLAIYELALLTAVHLSGRGADAVRLGVVTPEAEPLGIFGASSPAILRELLDEAGVELLAEAHASHVEGGELHLASGGEPLPADRVVALPRLGVPELPGVPQRARGFIPTDVRMNVEGIGPVWAAGDATWFPIKHGGLATQQADVAVSAIATHLGATTRVVPYRAVLRGALLTGSLPQHFRANLWDGSESEASAGTLWWPPGKLAGRFLTPYLARRSGAGDLGVELSDLDAASGSRDDLEREQLQAIELCIAGAEADAREGDLQGALEWLDLVEEISLVLPPQWAERQEEWRRAVAAGAQQSEARL